MGVFEVGNQSKYEITCSKHEKTNGLLTIGIGTDRGCGSHSWKLLKSPICSHVQLIPNCFEKKD